MADSDTQAPAVAIVFTYVPSEDRTYHTIFTEAEDCPDPLKWAHAFRESEEKRGDFPGSIWAVTGDTRAGEILTANRMAELFGDPDLAWKS